MNIIFDAESVLRYLQAKESDSIAFERCERLLTEECDVIFVSSKEWAGDEFIGAWLNSMSDVEGCNSSFNYDDKIIELPVSENTVEKVLSDKKLLTSVYCISDEAISLLKETGKVLVSDDYMELDILSSLFWGSLQFSKDIADEISGWDKLKKYCSPCSDIIIVDKFVLDNTELYKNNIFKILSVLCNGSNKDVNVVIYTLYEKNDAQRTKLDLGDVYNIIKQKFPSINLTIYASYKDSFGTHDRWIITNYKMFYSGPGFDIFDSSGILHMSHSTNQNGVDDNISVYSLVYKENQAKASRLLRKWSSMWPDKVTKGVKFYNILY